MSPLHAFPTFAPSALGCRHAYGLTLILLLQHRYTNHSTKEITWDGMFTADVDMTVA